MRSVAELEANDIFFFLNAGAWKRARSDKKKSEAARRGDSPLLPAIGDPVDRNSTED
jgi:hypothetical protein